MADGPLETSPPLIIFGDKMATEEKHPLPIDASTDNGASSNIGWYNKETDNWDKDEPDLPAFMKKDDK